MLEDNPYGLLGFEADPMRALRADEAEGVIYLGSFSKTFSPGMRVGWALAPHAVREKLVLAQESATLCPPSFSQMAVSAYLETHDWQGQIKQMREMYRERRDAMMQALSDFLPAAVHLEHPRRRLLRVGDAAARHRRQGDAAAGGDRAGGLRAGTAFFADGFGSGLDAALLLLPDARADPRGRAPPGRACSSPRWSCGRRSAPGPPGARRSVPAAATTPPPPT